MTHIRLPETMSGWPFPRRISLHYPEVAEESASWIRQFNAFTVPAQRAFDRCKFGLLAALSYPTLNREQYRSACDLMNLFFVFDEHTDTLDESGTALIAQISMDALMHPNDPRPPGESVIGEITRQFWSRAIEHATPTARRRFEDTWLQFTNAVVEQACDRDRCRLRTAEEYLALRRLTIGARPCYALAELWIDLPEDMFHHELVEALRTDVTEIIILDNDMASYNKEQATGDDLHNIITVIMKEQRLELSAALQWLAAQHKLRVNHILSLLPKIKILSAECDNQALAVYVDHIVNWPRANDCWNFESGRYFGNDGLHIQQNRLITLLPSI